MAKVKSNQYHRIELEDDIIGNLLFSSVDLPRTFGLIEPQMFYSAINQQIYRTMIEMYERGRIIGANEMAAYLLTYHKIAIFENGNPTHVELLTKLAACEPTGILDKCIYIRVLYEKRIMEEIRMKPDYESALDLLEELNRCKEITSVEDWQNSTELIDEQIKFIETMKASGGGLQTGINAVDFLMSGMKPGELIILAARPGVGKSAFAINIALNVAKLGIGVGVISLEMPNAQNISRIASNLADFSFGDIMRGKVTDADLEAILSRLKDFQKYPIYMSDTSKCTAMDIRAKCMNLKRRQKNLGLIVIDYLQLIERDESKNKSTNDEIGKISRSLKLMAKELNIPILALAQLSREIEKRSDPTPKNSDLRDSGNLEQDADKICFLTPRPGDDNEVIKAVEYHQTKGRNSMIGKCDLFFEGKHMRYYDRMPNETPPMLLKNNFKDLPPKHLPF